MPPPHERVKKKKGKRRVKSKLVLHSREAPPTIRPHIDGVPVQRFMKNGLLGVGTFTTAASLGVSLVAPTAGVPLALASGAATAGTRKRIHNDINLSHHTIEGELHRPENAQLRNEIGKEHAWGRITRKGIVGTNKYPRTIGEAGDIVMGQPRILLNPKLAKKGDLERHARVQQHRSYLLSQRQEAILRSRENSELSKIRRESRLKVKEEVAAAKNRGKVRIKNAKTRMEEGGVRKYA